MSRLDKIKQEIKHYNVKRTKDLPASHIDDFIRLQKKVSPFELQYPETINGSLWATIYLWGKFLDQVPLNDIEAQRESVVKELVTDYVLNSIKESGFLKEEKHIKMYLAEQCSSRPLKLPDKKEFEKFKLMKELE